MRRLGRLAVSAAAITTAISLAACGGSGSSIPSAQQGSQPITQQSAQQSIIAQQQVRPRFTVLRYRGAISQIPVPGALPTWNGSFTHSGTTYHFTMVGTDPSSTNTTTTIPVALIPLKIVIGTDVFAPSKKLPNGNTVMQNVQASPIFQNSVDYVQGGTDLGKTQYEDAFQRGNFWSSVQTNTGYHVVLAPLKKKVETLKPSASVAQVGTEFGVKVGLVDINYIDQQLNLIISKLKIPPSTFPVFITSDVYETEGGCCIGGYHSFNGTNTYTIATYVDKPGAFSQDVSALSHEIGEWYDDPLTNNNVACGILEVGDPLENRPNYGGYPYTTNGFTYNLQDLVFLPYFGAPASTSVNSWSTFQGETLGFCSQGG